MPTVLFFDIDSTLVENQFSPKVVFMLLTQMTEASGKSVDELAQEMNDENSRRQQTDPDNILTMDWDDIVQQMARRYGVTLSDNVDRLWAQMADSADVTILDDAPSVLEKLRAEHRTLVIATKGLSKYQNPVLHVSGLHRYFDDILTPDITGYLKTSPAFFDAYCSHDALFIHIGDHYYDDVICAKRNGFYSILRAPIADLSPYDPFTRPRLLQDHFKHIATYPTAGSDIRPDAVVNSLQEVPDVVAQIEYRQVTF